MLILFIYRIRSIFFNILPGFLNLSLFDNILLCRFMFLRSWALSISCLYHCNSIFWRPSFWALLTKIPHSCFLNIHWFIWTFINFYNFLLWFCAVYGIGGSIGLHSCVECLCILRHRHMETGVTLSFLLIRSVCCPRSFSWSTQVNHCCIKSYILW